MEKGHGKHELSEGDGELSMRLPVVTGPDIDTSIRQRGGMRGSG